MSGRSNRSQVLQFLQHDGYVETARAFAEEVHEEKKALSLDPNAVIHGFDVKEDEDAGHRQREHLLFTSSNVQTLTRIQASVQQYSTATSTKPSNSPTPIIPMSSKTTSTSTSVCAASSSSR
jgi:hypothetical protein